MKTGYKRTKSILESLALVDFDDVVELDQVVEDSDVEDKDELVEQLEELVQEFTDEQLEEVLEVRKRKANEELGLVELTEVVPLEEVAPEVAEELEEVLAEDEEEEFEEFEEEEEEFEEVQESLKPSRKFRSRRSLEAAVKPIKSGPGTRTTILKDLIELMNQHGVKAIGGVTKLTLEAKLAKLEAGVHGDEDMIKDTKPKKVELVKRAEKLTNESVKKKIVRR